jgi:hypothetical protein
MILAWESAKKKNRTRKKTRLDGASSCKHPAEKSTQISALSPVE